MGKKKAIASEKDTLPQAKNVDDSKQQKSKKINLTPFLKWSQLLANVAIVIGLIVAGMTLWHQSQQAKVNSANELLSEFHSERISKARDVLHEFWGDQDLRIINSGLPRETIDTLINKTLIASRIDESEFDTSIVQITQFLDEVSICRDEGGCDQNTVDKRLGAYARNFFCVYKSLIEGQRMRRLLPQYGSSLAKWIYEKQRC